MASRSLFEQSTQVHASGTYDDTLAAGEATLQTAATELQYDLNALRSQVKRILDYTAGDWFDDVPTITTTGGAKKRSLKQVAEHLDELEEQKLLYRTQVLTDITVPASAFATGTLTQGAAPDNNDTVVIGSRTLTWKTALSAGPTVPDEILIEVTASDSLDNLIDALTNGIGGPNEGVKYSVGTAVHADVNVAAGAGDTMDATAKVAGTLGNLIATTADAPGSWADATLTGGAGDIVVLIAASSEAPTVDVALLAATNGAVTIENPTWTDPGVTDPVWDDAAVAASDSNPLNPKNLVLIRDADSGDPIVYNNKEVYGLIQVTNDAVDADPFDDLDNQGMISFVIEDPTGESLIQCPAAGIAGKKINYSYANRINFDALPEDAYLAGVFADLTGNVDVTLQNAVDGQGATPVVQSTDIIIGIADTKKWEWTDDASGSLFSMTANAPGTSTVAVGSAVDVFDVNAASNDFAAGASFATAGQTIKVGVTPGTIESDTGEDLTLMGTALLAFSDGFQAASTYDTPLVLSDSSDEWDDFETAFGEVSLLNAIVQCREAKRTKGVAVLSAADINANTNVRVGTNVTGTLPAYDKVPNGFVDDVDVYVNGQLMWNGVDVDADHDVYPGTSAALGDLKFEFKLFYRAGVNPDVITSIVWGQGV